jgi:hypothetical protein
MRSGSGTSDTQDVALIGNVVLMTVTPRTLEQLARVESAITIAIVAHKACR